jgi:hypothetical protein
VSRKKGHPTDSDSDDDYMESSDEQVQARPQSTKKGVTKKNVRGRGSENLLGRGRGTSRGQSSSALADPLLILIFHILRMSWLLFNAQLVTVLILLWSITRRVAILLST